jgi:hypothetical protein
MQYEMQRFYLSPKFGTLIRGSRLQIFGVLTLWHPKGAICHQREVKWFGYYMHRLLKKILDEIDIKTIINYFASRSVRRNF